MIDLTKKTEDELKVIAYDLLVSMEVTKQNLKLVNQVLADRVMEKSNKKAPLKEVK